MVLERRGRVKWSHDRSNWKQEDLDACDRQAVRLACLLDGSRMSREVHVRFCERPVVQSRRPTHRLPTSVYCWSYTAVLLYFLPWASVPCEVTVRLLPSSDTTILPVVVTFVPFFTWKSNS